jgi:hypothetical protein
MTPAAMRVLEDAVTVCGSGELEPGAFEYRVIL